MTRSITFVLPCLAWLFTGLSFETSIAQPSSPPAPASESVGSVNGQPVLESDFLRFLVKKHRERPFGKNLLDNLRDRLLVEQGMARQKIEVTSRDVDQAFDDLDRRIRAETEGSQSLSDILKRKGTNIQEFRTYLERLVAVRKIVRLEKKLTPEAAVSDDEVRKWLQDQVRTVTVITDAKKLPEHILLKVGEHEVNTLDFGREILAGLTLRDRAQELNQMLHERVIEHQLKAHRLTLSEEDLDAALERERQRYAANPQTRNIPYESILEKTGTSIKERKRDASFRANAAILKITRTLYSDADLKSYYESQPDRFGPSRHIRHILVKTNRTQQPIGTDRPPEEALKRIQELRRRIEGGESFEKVARQESDDRSRFQGGDLGFVYREDRIDPALTHAAFALEVGAVSQPIQTRFGYHLVQVVATKPAAPFLEVRDRLLRARAQDWFREAVASARLENRHLDALKKQSAPVGNKTDKTDTR